MNNATDPISEALDRLARAADANPLGDPMPGIMRKARANRRRATALVASGLAAVVAASFTLSSALDSPRAAQDPGTPTPQALRPSPLRAHRRPRPVSGLRRSTTRPAPTSTATVLLM